MAFIDRLAVTFEFELYGSTPKEIEAEIKRRADEFFGDDEYTAGWVDITVTDDDLIKVSANVYIPNEDHPFPTELGG